MTQRILNALPSPPPEVAAEALAAIDYAAAIPTRIILPGVPPLTDQGSSPTCTAHASYGVYQWWHKKVHGAFAPIDEGAIQAFYALVKTLDGIPYADGTTLLWCLRVMAGSGYPLSTGKRGPKITGYAFVGNTAEAANRAIAQYQTPILYRVNWDANWFYLPTSRILKAPVGQTVGGHAMFSFGYDLNVNGESEVDRNSWGAWSAGGNGNCYFADRYKDAAFFEAWRVTGIN